ncbi:pentatricopeptide repeat-containing protein At5g43790-like [Magnolia sinica]|uniref:pentatricopeptide repeat-containing protein At5g43790-like n=1 Tax=Magnolia sinica TaxID=86752 RepID=UPI002659CEF5|nr:pentatricopeptide repeat-containing protein At5g43790-like [Magnolia sinica]
MQPHAANSLSSNQHLQTLLHSCNSLSHLNQIHAHLLKSSLHLNPSFAARLVSLYSSFKSISNARSVFDAVENNNIFLWNAMIKGYSMSHRTHKDALEMFGHMLSVYDSEEPCCLIPNEFTFPYLLKSCDFLEEARQVHAHVCKSFIHLGANVFICAALIDAYERCGSVKLDAQKLFDKMPQRDVVCWNTMICGYSKAGDFEMVLALFQRMLEDTSVVPSSTTVVNVLGACGETGAIVQGKWIHQFVRRRGNEMNIFVETALVTMYSKCGDVLAARQVFDCSPWRDLVLWSAMVGGYGINGCGREALELFHLMEKEGLKPDGVTFVSLLSACSHAGLIDEGLNMFHSMKRLYGVEPKMEHYACVVDLLGRAGQLGEALSLIKAMPMAPGASVWGALLGACRLHRDVRLGEKAANELFKIEGENGGNCMLLCNIYAEAGFLADALRLRRKMRKQRITKSPGCSCIEVGERVHCFKVGDRAHHQTVRIYETLEGLALQAFDEGFMFQPASSLSLE